MFSIIANEKVIGHSEFEFGDPPMGVAFGNMIATEEFTAFQANHAPDETFQGASCWHGLSANHSAGGALVCRAVVLWVHDVGGSVEFEVTAFEIDAEQYTDFFARHIAAYEGRFS